MAGAIITLFLGSLFALNSNMVHLLRSASETANASQELQTSVEKLRLANWTQITDPAWFTASFFGTPTDAQRNLPGLVETITVAPFASPTSVSSGTLPTSFTITYQNAAAKAAPATYPDRGALQQQEMLRVDVTVTWPSLYRSRSRSLTTLVSRWGISK